MRIRVALAIWLVLLVALSISPLSFKLKAHTVGALHDFIHYSVYGLTAILFWFITHRPLARVAGFILGLSVAFGQEWAENKLYHAGFEWNDVRTDLAGLISGFAFMLLVSTLLNTYRSTRV